MLSALWNYFLVNTDTLASNCNEMAEPRDWRDNSGITVLFVAGILLFLFVGCETVGTAFKAATGSCITTENLTSSQYVVISTIGDGSRKKVRYGESKTHNILLSGDEDEVDMTISIIENGETLVVESDEVRFDDDKAGCELVSVSLKNKRGFNIEF